MKKYKIAILTPTFPPKSGGIATAHYNIFQLLRGIHNVKVFAYNDDPETSDDVIKRKTPKWLQSVIKFAAKLYLRRYKQKSNYANVIRILSNSYGVWRLNKSIKEFAPDILIVPDNNIPLYWIAKKNFKIAWFTHNIYLRFRDNPLISNYTWIDIDIACSMERKAIKKADALLSPSKYMITEYNKAFNYNHTITVIHNFIVKKTIDNILLKGGAHINFNKKTVFIPSGGTINKGSRYVFEIIRRISDALENNVEFCITGSIASDLRFELQFLNKEIKVHAPGHVSWENNIMILNNCSLVVSPTLIENFSNAFVEAFVLGKPIVTFDVGGNNEIIDNDVNGFIVPYLDVNMLTERAIMLLKNEGKLQQFGEQAKQKAELFCDENKLINQYNEFFNSIIEG